VTTFIAIDGEADSDGRYIVMCDSLGRELVNLDGLTTMQVFTWLFALHREHPRAKLVCFGLNYDVNQWIRDLTVGELTRLARDGRASHRMRYKLTWLPRKLFTVTDAASKEHFRIAEVFGFYQTSFVRALRAWGLEPTKEIERMKARRGRFSDEDLRRVVRYCKSECRLLVELMDSLAAACVEADCAPARDWIGAGAIASTLLRTAGVKGAHAYDSELADREIVEGPILRAYFGGRVEMLAQGVAPAAHSVDVKSAYPYAATLLPALDRARLYNVKRYDAGAEHAIWRVKWEGQNHNGVCPFPVRLHDFSIVYPESGEGCYHACEVRAALACGYMLRFDGGVKLRSAVRTDRLPFGFIPRLFALRDRYKRAGHPAEKALKLGLNSVYGKLAQGYGFADQPPPFQSYLWAGEITARTRATMLRAVHAVKLPLMISTDGMFSVDRMGAALDGVPRQGLGSLERGVMRDPFIVQAGVYSRLCDGCDGAGCEACAGTGMAIKSRGFAARDVDYRELRQVWHDDGPDGVYHYRSRRFIGLRVALARNKLDDIWRTWPIEQRSLTLQASRKLTPDGRGDLVRLGPLPGPYESLPYIPKINLYDDPTDDTLELMIADDQPDIG
jgi:hypothetical protein